MKKNVAFIRILTLVLSLLLFQNVYGAELGSAVDPDGGDGGGKWKAASVYIVIMDEAPVAAYEGGAPGLAATKPEAGGKIAAESQAVLDYASYLVARHDAALAAVGAGPERKIYDYTMALNGFAARLTRTEAAALAARPGVLFVRPDALRHKTADGEPEFLNLFPRYFPRGGGIKRASGENVVVGVIDTGIWPEHPSFADDGTYGPSPVGSVPCTFGNTGFNPDDAVFTCNNKLLGARQFLEAFKILQPTAGWPDGAFDSARDDDGHGTHTASTAAGNRDVDATVLDIDRGAVSGVAPRARVIAYKALGYSGSGFTSDLAAAINQAVADGVDVINYSIGGGASLTGADDLAFLFAADAGVFCATSAGNSGPGASTLGGPGTVPWITTAGASTRSLFYEGAVVLGNGSEYAGVSITGAAGPLPLVDAANHGNEYCLSSQTFTGDLNGKIVLCRRGINNRVDKSYAVSLADGEGMILYNNDDIGDLSSDTHWVPSLHVHYTPGQAIKNYIAANGASATARIEEGVEGEWAPAPSMASFSSRGPNPVAPDIVKPDVTAPGVQILAGHSPLPVDADAVKGELFQAISGTSMASPHVAGLFALLKEAHPDWTPAMAKSAVMTTADTEVWNNDRVSMAGPFDMGAGHIRYGWGIIFPWRTLAAAESASPELFGLLARPSAFAPGLVYDAGFNDYLGFLCDAEPEAINNPEATCGALESQGIAVEAVNLNLPSIGIGGVVGTQTVKRRVTSVSDSWLPETYTAHVEAPPGFAVTVKPDRIRLAKGRQAEFEVTVDNVGAPIGEWRFGALTWKTPWGLKTVRSPIAVRAELFEAPDEIEGSGVSGSADFDIKFGYSGVYGAGPHGPVPATTFHDNVLQDPDQTFNPSDGFSDLFEIDLLSALHFRVAIPPEATEAGADLDIFVYNPNGVRVASSTEGGTDEQVDISMPMDGKWKVYVHGWSTPGGDSDYTLHTWAISAALSVNLNVDSAPLAAVSGTTAPVEVSWMGATAGQWHLGGVSHTGNSGLMGLTLINIDNR